MNMEGRSRVQLKNIDIYKAKMEKIDFMREHLNDIPEIFNVNSEKCKLFLIKSFTVLNPNFHYLSLVGNDSVEQELSKAACILQIYPFNPNNKALYFFNDMSEEDIHAFWMRFFKRCELLTAKDESCPSESENVNGVEFDSVFCNMKEILQYMQYEISSVNPKKPIVAEVKEEINSWITTSQLWKKNNNIFDSHLMTSVNGIDFNETKKIEDLNVDFARASNNLTYIKKVVDDQQFISAKPTFYKNFFEHFNLVVQQVMLYKNNLKYLISSSLSDIKCNTDFSKSFSTSNDKQIKKCNTLILTIKSKTNI